MNALSIQGLVKTYPNGVEALKGIDLDVEQGDFFALLGPNGAGKTTAIGVIASLVNKTAGSVRVFGHSIDSELRQAKSCLGLVPQEVNFNLFETVENIVINQAGFYGIPRPLACQRAEHYLRQLRLWDKRKDLSRNLSGGMKRRLMIARALVHEPALLILDEPTAGVDIEIRRSMWAFLKEINAQGKTIILTTHYLEEAETLCRNVAIIDGGRIKMHDRMSRILRKLAVQTFILSVDCALTEAPKVPGFTTRLVGENDIEVDVEESRSLNELFELLAPLGLRVASIRTKTNRLEELFMRLVESSAADVPAAAEAGT